MKIVLLGAGGYHPNSHRQTTCLMIPERGILLDAGGGAYRVADRLQTERLDVFLSHAHLDHVVGLTFLLGLFEKDAPERMTLHGEAEKLAAVRTHLYDDMLFPVTPNFHDRVLDSGGGSQELAGGGRVAWFPMEHPGGSLGFRFEGLDPAHPERTFAYVTDTMANPEAAYVDHIRGVDLLVHEAYFDDSQRAMAELTGHSCVNDAARVAAEAGVGRLVLTHMNPRVDKREPFDLSEARRLFADVAFGQDEMEVEL